MPPAELREIDGWIKARPKPKPTRPQAIRRLVKQALAAAHPRGAHKGAAKAKAMAGEQIERMIDPAAPAEDRRQRKRRLLKGPSEFREMRTDLPKSGR